MKKLTLAKAIPYILIIAGIIGLISAFSLTWDELKIAQNPTYQPSCNLNPIISCGSVMESGQAKAFGFPNPWIGLTAFAVLLTVGVSLLAGAKYKRWFWLGLEAGTLFGVGFVHWLFYQTVYQIHALCPWCMVVWVVVIPTFWYVTLYNIEQGVIKLPAGNWQSVGAFVRRHHLDILVLWYLIILVLILNHFWYYFGKHLF
jgi:uncharacterized membrane protein